MGIIIECIELSFMVITWKFSELIYNKVVLLFIVNVH